MLFLFIFINTLTNIRQINWILLKLPEQKMLLLKTRKHYIIWHTTISKIVHPSLSKDIKSTMQIKRDKCCSLMLLCLKIYCIKLEPNKQSS